MGIRNKYIATGLGIALAFTSTCFNYGYFTATDSQENIIIMKAREKEAVKFSNTRYSCWDITDNDTHKSLYMDFSISNKEDGAKYRFEVINDESSEQFKNTDIKLTGGTISFTKAGFFEFYSIAEGYSEKTNKLTVRLVKDKNNITEVIGEYKIVFSHNVEGRGHYLSAKVNGTLITSKAISEIEDDGTVEEKPTEPEQTPGEGSEPTEPEQTPGEGSEPTELEQTRETF